MKILTNISLHKATNFIILRQLIQTNKAILMKTLKSLLFTLLAITILFPAIAQQSVEERAKAKVAQYSKQLQLSQEQVNSLHPLVAKYIQQHDDLKQASSTGSVSPERKKALQDNFLNEVTPILNETQLADLKKIMDRENMRDVNTGGR
jgi:hypothetical protein